MYDSTKSCLWLVTFLENDYYRWIIYAVASCPMQYTATPIPRSFRMYISLNIHMDRRVYKCIGRVSCASYAYMLFNDAVLVSRFSSRIRCRWTLGVIGNKLLCGWMWLYQHIPYYPDELGVSFEYLVSDTRSIYPPLSGISPHLCASMFLVKYAHWIIKRNSSKLFPRIVE